MRIVVINLKRAVERREQVAREFAALGLAYEIREAIDGRYLSDEQLSQVDWEGRRRLGLHPPADGGIANWLTQRKAMQDLVENGPNMMAVFEDDVRLDFDLPVVLEALERRQLDFDVVALQRRHPRRRFFPCIALTDRHTAGRVRFSDSGSEGYVITRTAARRLLDVSPKMVLSTDHAVLRYWANGLNVFYVDPPVVHHRGYEDTFIGTERTASRRLRAEANYTVGLWKRVRLRDFTKRAKAPCLQEDGAGGPAQRRVAAGQPRMIAFHRRIRHASCPGGLLKTRLATDSKMANVSLRNARSHTHAHIPGHP